MVIKYRFLLFIFFGIALPLSGQVVNHVDFMFSKIEINEACQDLSDKENKDMEVLSEIDLSGLGLIRFYQLFISTQDKPACNFSHSCSNFGMTMIKERGMLKGCLLTADRLTRCNSLTQNEYKIDPLSLRAVDDVMEYQRRTE